jgi:hypothetical protein
MSAFGGTRIGREQHYRDVITLLNVYAAQLRDFAGTRTRVGAQPWHPPLRSLEGRVRLSDAELIQQLADTAKELGIEINLNYSFLQPNKPDDEPQG